MKTMTDEINDILTGNDASPWLRAALRAALQRDPVAVANDAERLAHLLMEQVENERFCEADGSTADGETPVEAALPRTRRNAVSPVECSHLAGAICGPCWIRARLRQRQGLAGPYRQSSSSAAQASS